MATSQKFGGNWTEEKLNIFTSYLDAYLIALQNQKFKKKKHLRNNEYYNLQNEFDKLYEQSKNGKKFKNLLELIESEENIQLAYRNIKKNKVAKQQELTTIQLLLLER